MVNTLNPVWDEDWIVRNVPPNAKLSVEIYDKDDGKFGDDYIGKFQIDLQSMTNELIDIRGRFDLICGQFRLSIISLPTSPDAIKLRPYTFDGPVRYSRRNSRTVGHLTKSNDERLHSTWEISLKRIDFYFHPHEKQKYNSSYSAAKEIFEGPKSYIIQSGIRQGHRVLYAKHTTNQFGSIHSLDDFWTLFLDPNTQRINPCVYTYIIDDHTWRFSETGASFFVDFASKHALHANGATTVVYAGEFHPRPVEGWDQYDIHQIRTWDQWELVMDNGSGTYAPNLILLGKLKDLLSFNFPQLNIQTYDYKDPELKSSIEACRHFGKESRSISTLKHLVLFPMTN